MSATDLQALSIDIKEELASIEARLLSELSAIIVKQHETLLSNLVSNLNSPNVQKFNRQAEPALLDKPKVTDPASAEHVPERRPSSGSQENTRLLPQHDVGKTQSMEAEPDAERMQSSDDNTEEEQVKLKVDGSFGSVFSASVGGMDDLDAPHYHVEDYYFKSGCAQHLAQHEYFVHATLGVICLNAVYIGVDADWNDAESLYDAKAPFIFMDNAFCVYFTFELAVRFFAFEIKRNSIRDGWFRFDLFLVCLMIFETWLMAPIVAIMGSGGASIPVQPLRLLRLLRLTRMTRLMRSLPELVTMTKGMQVASRAVLSSLMMVMLLVYTFAIVLNMGLKEEDKINDKLQPRNFRTIPRTMWTLLMDGTFMDSTGTVLTSLLFSGKPTCWACCIVFMMFILFSAITVMNMLIGVLCEVVSAVAQSEKDDAAIRLAKASILVNLKKYDNGKGLISLPALMNVFKDKSAKAVLSSLNVDLLFMLELQQLLFTTPETLVPIKEIMELMLMCRGDLSVTVQHVASAQASLLCSIEKLERRLADQFADLRAVDLQQFANAQDSLVCTMSQLEQRLGHQLEALRPNRREVVPVLVDLPNQTERQLDEGCHSKREHGAEAPDRHKESMVCTFDPRKVTQGESYVCALPDRNMEGPGDTFCTPSSSPRSAAPITGQQACGLRQCGASLNDHPGLENFLPPERP